MIGEVNFAEGSGTWLDPVRLVAEAILASPLLRWLPSDALQRITETGEILHFQAGDQLFEEGERCDGVHVLLTGSVTLTRSDRDLAVTVGAGEVIGGLPGNERNAAAWAEEDTAVLRIPNGLFAIICRHDDTVRQHVTGR